MDVGQSDTNEWVGDMADESGMPDEYVRSSRSNCPVCGRPGNCCAERDRLQQERDEALDGLRDALKFMGRHDKGSPLYGLLAKLVRDSGRLL